MSKEQKRVGSCFITSEILVLVNCIIQKAKKKGKKMSVAVHNVIMDITVI